MAEDTNSSQMGRSIHIYEVRELRYWTQALGISSDALVSAVRAVGPSEEKVREYLRTH